MISELRRAVHDLRSEYLTELEALVRIETPSRDVGGMARFATHLTGVLERDGWQVATHAASGTGPIVEARLAGASGPSTLLLTHYDTVHPVGAFGADPWRAEDDVARGPGVLDMKAGIVAAIVAARVLGAAGLAPEGPVTLLATSDEETGSHASRERIEDEARRADRVYVLEPSRDDGALKVGRKGTADYHLTFAGRAAHAGLAPETGANALLALAHAAIALAELANPELGTTVTPSVARAGTAVNVVPDEARLSVDTRLPTMAEAERVDAAVRGYAPQVAGVRCDVAGGLNRPPMEDTPANRRLFEAATRVAASWGW
jgi:glutamate carboxypeptidase